MMNGCPLHLRYILYVLLHFWVAVYAGCPCKEEKWCEPIQTKFDHEVPIFILSKTNYIKYDWTRITSAIQFTGINNDITCYAHSKGARSIFSVNFPRANLTNPQDRGRWVAKQVATAQKYFQDGINVDFEDEIDKNDPTTREALTLLYKELADAFRQQFKNPQISFDFAWSPDCIDKRCYDYPGLASLSDFVFIMSYDERSQITGECMAFANSAYNTTVHGVERYISLGIPPGKIVLGVPWYGYVYPCIHVDEDFTCKIKEVPFRGVNCSDAAGSQANYANIVNDKFKQAISKIKFHPIAKSPYFLAQATLSSQVEQIWYDNPQSLTYKFKFAVSRGLLGVGMWNADSLDYSDTPEGLKQRQEMWDVIPYIRHLRSAITSKSNHVN